MFNVLIIDDDVKRSSRLKSRLVDIGVNTNSIILSHSVNSGKENLEVTTYDLVIIDIVLPKRDNEKKLISDAGISLLYEIKRRKKYKLPRRIIGITSNLSQHSNYREKFSELCELVIPVEFNSDNWILKILDDVSYRISSKLSENEISSDKVVVSIHGIRTFGAWQNRLCKIIESKNSGFTYLNHSYGYLDLLSFLIPFLRFRTINRLHSQIEYWINVNSAKQFYFIAHSFGTYILLKSLEKIIANNTPCNIKCVIFCGSVIKSSYNWDNCRGGRNFTIINECGTNDFILWLSHLFAPFLGMAGKTGFSWLNSERQINRYHVGGHSLYFEENSKPSDDFMSKYWLPILIHDEIPCHVDNRVVSLFHHGIFETLITHLGIIFYPLICLIIFAITYC